MTDKRTQAENAINMIRAQISIWREDKAAGLTPTDGSFERVSDRLRIIEAALNKTEVA